MKILPQAETRPPFQTTSSRSLAVRPGVGTPAANDPSEYGEPIEFIRAADVLAMLSISRTTLYARTNPADPGYDPTFPVRIHVHGKARSTFYVKQHVQAWMRHKVEASLGKAAAHHSIEKMGEVE